MPQLRAKSLAWLFLIAAPSSRRPPLRRTTVVNDGSTAIAARSRWHAVALASGVQLGKERSLMALNCANNAVFSRLRRREVSMTPAA